MISESQVTILRLEYLRPALSSYMRFLLIKLHPVNQIDLEVNNTLDEQLFHLSQK